MPRRETYRQYRKDPNMPDQTNSPGGLPRAVEVESFQWRNAQDPSYKRRWLPDGTMVDVTYCDSAGPGSHIHLNSFAIFVRFNLGDWEAGASREYCGYKQACNAIDICETPDDVREVLGVVNPGGDIPRMSRDELDAIEAAEQAATPGPWANGEHVGEPRAIVSAEKPDESLLGLDTDDMAIVFEEADARLIVLLRNSALRLVERVRQAEAARKDYANTGMDLTDTAADALLAKNEARVEVARLAARCAKLEGALEQLVGCRLCDENLFANPDERCIFCAGPITQGHEPDCEWRTARAALADDAPASGAPGDLRQESDHDD